MGWIIGLLVVAFAIEFLFARSLWRTRNEAEDSARKARRDAFEEKCLRENLVRQFDAIALECNVAQKATLLISEEKDRLAAANQELQEQIAMLKAKANKKKLPAKAKAALKTPPK